MSKTVVGIFENESDAQNAQNYLLANGFGNGDVDIKTASYKSGTDDSSSEDSEPNLMERIGIFFRELFATDEEETAHHIEAGKRGTIVTVHATDADEAVAAAHIMDEFGAVDVMDKGRNKQAGRQFEDPIVNPPAVSNPEASRADSVDARGLYLRSRIIDRALEPQFRLGQHPTAAERAANPDTQENIVLQRTIAERDALINQIVDNDQLKMQ